MRDDFHTRLSRLRMHIISIIIPSAGMVSVIKRCNVTIIILFFEYFIIFNTKINKFI